MSALEDKGFPILGLLFELRTCLNSTIKKRKTELRAPSLEAEPYRAVIIMH